MVSLITVKGKVIGQHKPAFPDWSVPLPPELSGSPNLTLRDLITHVVLQEVGAFKTRQEARRLTRVLSRDEIADSAARGKVNMGGQALDQTIEPDEAVSVALQAFEDGLYFVSIDGVQGKSLDQPVRVQPGSTITFVRLVLLAGG